LPLDLEGINQVVQEYDNETKALKEELFKICWFMRGASFSEAFALTYEDRNIIAKIIEGNMEITKETGHPFF
jgi:hypothetical protein